MNDDVDFLNCFINAKRGREESRSSRVGHTSK